MQQFAGLCYEAIQLSQIVPKDIDYIEMVGDATRTPAIQEILKQVFQRENLSRTLNALETVARGASLQAAIMSKAYNVAAYKIEDFSNLPISVTYAFEDKPQAAMT